MDHQLDGILGYSWVASVWTTTNNTQFTEETNGQGTVLVVIL